jgi:hypothetical protein
MSVELPIEFSVSQTHENATDDVNRWRGHCIECFSRLERGMGEALELMAGASRSSKRVPLTFGDKVKALRSAISPAGPFANARLLKALQEADALIDQRNRLVHATGKIWIDGSGGWAWTYRFKPAGKVEELGIYEQKAAHLFEVELARSSQGLCARLQAFRQKLAVTDKIRITESR